MRGYPSNAARKVDRDFRPIKPFNPVQRGSKRPRPANDRGVFVPRTRTPFGNRPAEGYPDVANIAVNLAGSLLGVAVDKVVDPMGIGTGLDNLLGGKNARYFTWPTFPPADKNRWHMAQGFNPLYVYGAAALAAYNQGMVWSNAAYFNPSAADNPAYWSPGHGIIKGQAIPVGAPYVEGVSYSSGTASTISLWYWSGSRGAQAQNWHKDIGIAPVSVDKQMAERIGFPFQWNPFPAPAASPLAPGIAALPLAVPPGAAPVPSTPLTPAQSRRIGANPYRPGYESVPGPVLEPEVVPAPSVDPRPGRQPSPGQAPGPRRDGHKRAPPPKGTKERKGRARAIQGFVGNVLGGLSEFGDLMDAAYDALPKDAKAHSYYKGKAIKPSWKKRWDAVYQNWDKVDLNQFFKNALLNDAQDEVIGRAHQGANRGMHKAGFGSTVNKFRRF